MSSNNLHIAVIGSGGSAMAAALKATERGARVTLVKEVLLAELVSILAVSRLKS